MYKDNYLLSSNLDEITYLKINNDVNYFVIIKKHYSRKLKFLCILYYYEFYNKLWHFELFKWI